MEHSTDKSTTASKTASAIKSSRKILTPKAAQIIQTDPDDSPKANLPKAPVIELPIEPVCGLSDATQAAPAQCPPAPAVWSSQDEAGYQLLLNRRKAAGYKQHGRDLSQQVLAAGSIKPNANTIVATIVALVADSEGLKRGELLTAMATASFPHPKAKPSDLSWCQGYVAGAIRNGFLVVVTEPSTDSVQEG